MSFSGMRKPERKQGIDHKVCFDHIEFEIPLRNQNHN